MPVGEFLAHMGDRSLIEMSYRVSIGNDLDIGLAGVEAMPAPEFDDWVLLYDIEAEAANQEAENERRKQ